MAGESGLLQDGLTSELEKYLQCSICQEILTDPVTLPCGHSYCMKCLCRVLETPSKTCPGCRRAIKKNDLNKSCLTFHPALGHGRLSFSKDKVTTKGTSSAGHRHDRFDNTQWMAQENLCEGINFWDVDTSRSVGYAIGVAYDRIGRREQLGRTLNSWCIEWKSRKETLSYWHNDLEEPLKHGNPRTVRVVLDLTGGSLYFYSLTDRQSLLHCVQHVFSEPVKPAFWLYGLKAQNTLLFPNWAIMQ
ncbi:E3 ubiquitin-protein ligase RNF135 [Aplochiton taeniatus]